jgi:RluA family pseudouridine synthase
VHRLDRDTSGVILVVKETAARASFGQLLLDGKLYKSYLAVVEGAPQEQEIDLPIGEIPVEGIRHKFGIDPKGKTARTRIVACRRVGERHSLATVEPITGRTHQIRVHLAAIGAPIVGDKLYSFTETEYLAWLDNPSQTVRQLPIDRHALHCASLSFVHPYTQKECRIEAELPRDMQELIARLSG